MKINQYVLEEGVLFKKGYLAPMLRCVGHLQASYVIREIRMGSCGMHIGARSVVAKAIRQGYYWPTMHKDVRNVTQKCDSCQENGLVERANKILLEGIKARLGRERVGWVDELPNVLWAHCTSLKQRNGETPFSFTYGSEAMILTKIGMPTHRTMMIREDENEDELRLNMDLLQVRRKAAPIKRSQIQDQYGAVL
ncbi:reverse transcriptase domain-containing protein [Tanacetum coccineum]|uniref:Reverse transcriptase domain-containing protein n=1 Tax=Tanacetum coccineum TaxID=301880 RepID=A0ABQ5B5R8_9ASTR